MVWSFRVGCGSGARIVELEALASVRPSGFTQGKDASLVVTAGLVAGHIHEIPAALLEGERERRVGAKAGPAHAEVIDFAFGDGHAHETPLIVGSHGLGSFWV